MASASGSTFWKKEKIIAPAGIRTTAISNSNITLRQFGRPRCSDYMPVNYYFDGRS